MTDISHQSATVPASRRYALHSERIGETFQIDVALPSFGRADVPLPVIYLTDANTVFGIAAQALRFLQNADGVPPALLVGVGYQLGGARRRRSDYGALRTRDLTPSPDAGFHALVLAERNGEPLAGDTGPAGGADAFLDFLIDELRPFIAGLYLTDPEDQTLVGSSLGGLFNLHALFSRPGAFQRHVANSPALWWDKGRLFDTEAALAARSTVLPARLFLSVGSLETQPPWDTVAGVRRLAARLDDRAYGAFTFDHHVFEDETHSSVIPAALSRGLRWVFTDGGLPSLAPTA